MKFYIIKRLFFVVIILINSLALFAQNTGTNVPPGGSPANDTLKSKKGPAFKVRIIDGAPMTSARNIVDNIAAVKDFSILSNALKVAALDETFQSNGPFTVFAPVDSAFKKLPKDKLDSLLDPKNKISLTNILTYHAIAGKLSSKDMEKQIRAGKGQAVFTTLAGGKLTATINQNRNIVLTDESGGQSIISSFDIEQSNGILHVLTSVLIPKTRI